MTVKAGYLDPAKELPRLADLGAKDERPRRRLWPMLQNLPVRPYLGLALLQPDQSHQAGCQLTYLLTELIIRKVIGE